jgi:hypothetical protein
LVLVLTVVVFAAHGVAEESAAPLLVVGKEMVEGGVEGEFDVGPVVESGAFEVAIANFEAEGTDEVEFGVGGGAGTGNIAGVGGIWG